MTRARPTPATCPNCRDQGVIGSGVPCGSEACGDCVVGCVVACERTAGGVATFNPRQGAALALGFARVSRDSARVNGARNREGLASDPRRRDYRIEQTRNAVAAARVFRLGERGAWRLLP